MAIALARKYLIKKVVFCPGNGGAAEEHSNPDICNQGKDERSDTDIVLMKSLCVDLFVVGPEQP